jgi:hypothetical protein
VAATWALQARERAAVAALRALLTLLGELRVAASRRADAIHLRLRLRSPLGGPRAARKRFLRVWQAKWESGGFFAPADLATLARRIPDHAAGRLGRLLQTARLRPPWSGWLAGWLLRGLKWLQPSELSCARLAARLARCRDALGRSIEPRRWARADALRLPALKEPLLDDLRERARLRAVALQARCDERRGQLENSTVLSACLPLFPCQAFVTCLLQSFRYRQPRAPGTAGRR